MVGLHKKRTGVVCAVMLMGLPAALAADVAPSPAQAELEARANALLNLNASTVFPLDINVGPATPFDVVVPIEGTDYTLSLRPHSIRRPGYKLISQVAGGGYVEHAATPIRTMRGSLVGMPGSRAAASLLETGLMARIFLADGSQYWIEPIGDKVEGAQPNDYVVYRGSDVIPSGGTCIAKQVEGQQQHFTHDQGNVAGGICGTQPHLAEIAADADVEYFQDYDTVEATEARIESVINSVNLQYEEDVEITHEFTSIIVRTAEPDPYTSTDPGTMLDELGDQWNSVHFGIQRDTVELFTGKDMVGSTIGIAWLGGLCGSLEYNVVQSDCCGSFGCTTDLSAHELGHNWGADHCTCPGWTMNAGLTCANQFHPTSTIPEIVAFRDGHDFCLDCAGDLLLRVILDGPTTVNEGSTGQFTATADFQDGPDLDVTTTAVWSIDPPEAGFVNSSGLLIPTDVDGNLEVTVTATYTYDGDQVKSGSMTVTIVDLDVPDPRLVEVTLSPSVDPSNLQPGQQFSADILASSVNGDVLDVRLLQFDSSLSSAVTIDAVNWDLQDLSDQSLYLFNSDPGIFTAAYVSLGSVPGFIVNLDATPQVVAHLDLTFEGGTGLLDVCGVTDPGTLDASVRFTFDFEEPVDFTQASGNVACTPLDLIEGDVPLEILFSSPPSDSIDARQPSNPDGTSPDGLLFANITFTGDASALVPGDFTVTEDGGDGVPPSIISVSLVNSDTVQVVFSQSIETGAWTNVTHNASGTSVRFGYLPGDVNGDGTSAAPDLLALIDFLNGISSLPIYSTDIDRSGLSSSPDVLREIDLLNGAGAYDPWLGVSLP